MNQTDLEKVRHNSLITLDEINENTEDKVQGYYTIQYIKQFWNKIYSKFIFPTISTSEGSPEEVIVKIDEVKSFILFAINDIYKTDINGVLKQLQKLQDLFSNKSFPIKSNNENLRPFIKVIKKINKTFDKMALVATNPNWLLRNFKKFIGIAKPKISSSNKDRILNIIEKSLLGATERLAEKLNIEENFINAFSILGLPFTASKEDVEKKRKYLSKKYHPDKNLSDQKMFTKRMSEINNAADLLLNEYYKKYGS